MARGDGQRPVHERFLFLGDSAAARRVREMSRRAARVEFTVLITGESGVGKELVARDIHLYSRRNRLPFIPVNCGAIPDTLIETELFGHEPGAYTDARDRRHGAFEMAHRGTLFLDEVGDLPIASQPKLLRAIETGVIRRVGGEADIALDLRIVAATNQDLRSMCANGCFRGDLYYRLCVIEIFVPPLRHRREDIPMLARRFAETVAGQTGRGPMPITDEALDRLREFDWPGNVRQLRHVIERWIAMTPGEALDASTLRLDATSLPDPVLSLFDRKWQDAREAFEAAYARQLLERHGQHVGRAAQAAGMAPGSLYKMLRRLNLPRKTQG